VRTEPADTDELVGQILLGKLEVIRKIGGGGMGVVYEVEHRLTGHRRALKVVHAKFADRPRFMKRLLREAKVAGTLKTPFVVETFDAGRLEDGSAYVLMELLNGRSFFEVLQAEGRLVPRRLAEIMAQVAEGMAVAHEAGIVHRDLKPENVFLLPDPEIGDRVKILDFGVSKFETSGEQPTRLTVEGTLVGTPYYMSPEQAAGRPVDARTDVYAMGVMMYEALAGRLPFEAETVGALFVKIGSGECVPLRIRRSDLDEKWCELVHTAFHRDPEKRFQTAELLRRELVQLLSGGATAARARTISDAARATLSYAADVPPPPKTPKEAEAFAAERAPSRDSDELEGEARRSEEKLERRSRSSAPPVSRESKDDLAEALPPPSPEPVKRNMPGWAWGVLGAALVLLIAIPWRLVQDDERPAQPVAQGESVVPEARAPSATPAERIVAAPAERLPPSAAAADAGAPLVEETPRPRPTKARAAGLDPNPYRR
jgi:serine/threonine protein kinase